MSSAALRAFKACALGPWAPLLLGSCGWVLEFPPSCPGMGLAYHALAFGDNRCSTELPQKYYFRFHTVQLAPDRGQAAAWPNLPWRASGRDMEFAYGVASAAGEVCLCLVGARPRSAALAGMPEFSAFRNSNRLACIWSGERFLAGARPRSPEPAGMTEFGDIARYTTLSISLGPVCRHACGCVAIWCTSCTGGGGWCT